MDTKDMIRRLRTEKGLSQDELAEKLFVTRQAVSRWENGETTPNPETLKQLSRLFDVSIPRHAQQMPEGVAAAVQCRGGADIQPLHGEVTAGEQLRRRVPLVRCDGAGRTCPGRRRTAPSARC